MLNVFLGMGLHGGNSSRSGVEGRFAPGVCWFFPESILSFSARKDLQFISVQIVPARIICIGRFQYLLFLPKKVLIGSNRDKALNGLCIVSVPISYLVWQMIANQGFLHPNRKKVADPSCPGSFRVLSHGLIVNQSIGLIFTVFTDFPPTQRIRAERHKKHVRFARRACRNSKPNLT